MPKMIEVNGRHVPEDHESAPAKEETKKRKTKKRKTTKKD